MPIAFAGSWTCQNIQVPWEQNQSPKMTPGMRAAEPDTKQPFEGFRLGWCGACDRGEQERKPALQGPQLANALDVNNERAAAGADRCGYAAVFLG